MKIGPSIVKYFSGDNKNRLILGRFCIDYSLYNHVITVATSRSVKRLMSLIW